MSHRRRNRPIRLSEVKSCPTNEENWDGLIFEQRNGEPVWDQTTIDRLWVTTQREAMIESGPPPAEKPPPFDASGQKAKKEETKKWRTPYRSEKANGSTVKTLLPTVSRTVRLPSVQARLWIMVLLGSGISFGLPNLENTESSRAEEVFVRVQQVSLSGWFHVIWNGEPRFVLIDDQGSWIELLLDEAVAKPLGGPRVLNRKRVKIVGERANGPSRVIRVLTIELE